MLPAPRLDHGVIGNGRVLALVAPDSRVDWLCLPRFDSPSVFASILDRDRGGTWRILARDRELTGRMAYVVNTNVLRTEFVDGDSAWEVIDFSPRIRRGADVDVPLELIRVVRPLRGEPRITIDFSPRPDYARAKGALVPAGGAIEIDGAALPMQLYTNLPHDYLGREVVLRRPLHFVLHCGRRITAPTESEVAWLLAETIAGWRAWVKTCALPTFAPNDVLRSALCLKLHAYHDTGAIIAAATTSIPEAMGTPRTWDYRYCWLRDASFVVEALRRLGHLQEGEQFLNFLRDVAESGPLQPLYGIDGERNLLEETLPHLAGFGGNGWVRVGNAAIDQRQN